MANQPETGVWQTGVYQLEPTDPVDGGLGAVSNLPLLQLADRTLFLRGRVDQLEAGTTVPPGIATEGFVTGQINRLAFKAPVRAATTANITLSGTPTIDGVALSVGDRVLVKNQGTASQNGVYVVASGAWARANDFNENTEVFAGVLVIATAGTTQADTIWLLTTDGTITVGTTPLAFSSLADIISGRFITQDSATGAAALPAGNTAQRPANQAGRLRYNTDLSRFEGNNGSAWGSLGGATGGGTDAVFYLNGQTINNDYTIPAGQNAMSAGPVTIADGRTVTVPDGSVWTVV